MAGFSDGVQLGGHGMIKNDDTVVMRVKVDGKYQGRRAPYIHWRGVAFDHYSRGEWRRSMEAPITRREISFASGVSRHHLLYDRPDTARPELERRVASAMRQEIYLEPLGYDVLFGASMPVAFEFESRWRERARKERNDEIRYPHTAGIRYVVYSDPNTPSLTALRAASGPLPEGYQAYLQIPPEVPPSVRDLAEDITRGAPTDYDKALAIESWLKDNLSYTLAMESPGEREPIEYFLFERRRGHCEYFSSAMAVMLRAVGVPSRNVNGFLGGEWNEYDEYIAVRAGDAHSWVEAYFPGQGWVTFDPTPSADIDRLGRGEDDLLARLQRFGDTLRFKWFKWVIEYDLYRQLSLFRKLGNLFRGDAGGFFKQRITGTRDWLREHRLAAIATGSTIAIAIFGVWLVRRRRRDARGGTSVHVHRRSRDPIVHVYRATVGRLARRGHRREPSTTPREHARALSATGVPGAAEFAELTELYYAAEYGAATTPDLVSRARRLADDIRSRQRQGKARGSTP
jgi:hypothetical protein